MSCVLAGRCITLVCSTCKEKLPMCKVHLYLLTLKWGDKVWAEWEPGVWCLSTFQARVELTEEDQAKYMSGRSGQTRFSSTLRWLVQTMENGEDEVNSQHNVSSVYILVHKNMCQAHRVCAEDEISRTEPAVLYAKL
jgi:hypothetical protein